MKNQLPFYYLLFFALLNFSAACNEAGTTQEETDETTEEAADVQEEGVANITDCTTLCPTNPSNGDYSISKACADCMRSNFVNNNYQIPQYNGSSIKGFDVATAELTEILNDIDPGNTAEVFTMLGVRANATSLTEPEVVFVLKETNTTTQAVTFTYYDFTRPCPTFCPDDN